MQILLISREDILLLHDFILAVSGGRQGIRDENVIESALGRPQRYMHYQAGDIHTVAALMLDSLARNHAFVEGNKRTALMCSIYAYAINGVYLEFNQEMNNKFEELVLHVVEQKPDIDTIRDMLVNLTDKYSLGTFELFIEKMKEFFASR